MARRKSEGYNAIPNEPIFALSEIEFECLLIIEKGGYTVRDPLRGETLVRLTGRARSTICRALKALKKLKLIKKDGLIGWVCTWTRET